MTSPALVVLSLALVCSGITSEQAADHGGMRNFENYQVNNIEKMGTKTNIFDHSIHSIDSNNYSNNYNVKNNHVVFDDIYTEDIDLVENIDKDRKISIKEVKMKKQVRDKVVTDSKKGKVRQYNVNSSNKSLVKRRARRDVDQELKCEEFKLSEKEWRITHPHNKTGGDKHYYSNANCVYILKANEGQVIKLTFVDVFHIESHAQCIYDYLEIRDGAQGYAKSLGRYCGEAFPPQIKSSGPYMWMKFSSDDTIEYEGFHINVAYETTATSHIIPASCNKTLIDKKFDVIKSSDIDEKCISGSGNQLDVVWTIETSPDTKIYLDFTKYSLEKPNECEDNVVQVFGSILEEDSKLAHYCGSVANSVTTRTGDGKGGKEERGNIMYVRMFLSKVAMKSFFEATFTAFRTLDPNLDEKCDPETEFDCEDNTCIDISLRCNHYVNCRLKTDEDAELCKDAEESMLSQPHILVILVIFSLILSGMSFGFLFKCIRKLYQDHKIIQEHIRQSCEDRLDTLSAGLTLDAKRLQRDSEPRASLERENHTNEMFKQQRSYSQHKPSSIDSDFIQETHLDLEEEPWRREVDSVPIEAQDIKIERNGRTRSDTSKKENAMRKKKEEEARSRKGSEEKERKREIRDVSVGAPDTKESGCQTRESLFQTEPASSDGSNGGSRGFSTFGYSGGTIARPSPAPTSNTSQITIELLKQVPPHQESLKSPKKIPDRRPMSAETTRSAPDVIIVSKPIR